MELKRLILSAAFVAMTFGGVMAQKAMHLPKAHCDIAQQQIDANLGGNAPYVISSLDAAAQNSPFAEFYSGFDFKIDTDADLLAQQMISFADGFIGTRYRSGASGPKAFDCSGFTSYIFKKFGITLNRSSRSQFLQGEKVTMENLRPGDLLFFSSRGSGRGNVGHVAMVVSVDNVRGTCQFIHASTKRGVTYQSFPDGGYYSRNFVGARRILGTELDPNIATAQL